MQKKKNNPAGGITKFPNSKLSTSRTEKGLNIIEKKNASNDSTTRECF